MNERSRTRWMVGVVGVCLWAAGVAGGAPDSPGTLVLTAENTVIVAPAGGAGGIICRYLVKFLAPPVGGAEMADPAASRYFPILQPTQPIPEGKAVIAVGNTPLAADEDRRQMAEKGWTLMLKRKGNAVLVLGDSRAEYEFLQQVAGIRAYAPEYIWWSRPKDGRIEVPADYVFGRRIAFFSSYYSGAAHPRNREWRAYNYMADAQNGLVGYHNIANLFPPAKYGQKHPEIYPMNTKGVRVVPQEGAGAWNPCYSAQALPDLAMDYVHERTKGNKQWGGVIALGIMDHAVECYCPDCQDSVKKTGGYSNVHWAFVNEVARRCRTEYPDLRITAFFYINIDRPVDMKLEPNITVKVVTKSILWSDPNRRKNVLSDLEAAGAGLGCSWWIHDWCFCGLPPRNNTYDYAEFLRWGQANGMVGAYIEWSNGQAWYLDGAKYHIIMELMKDPTQDVRALWRRYCDDMFGRGSKAMFRLHKHFARKMKTAYRLVNLGVDIPRNESGMYSKKDLARERRLLEKALAKTRDDPVVQKRLVHIMRYFKGHEMFSSAVYGPYQLFFQFKQPGVNRKLLAYYVNEDGRAVAEAYDYVTREMTQPPDDHEMEATLGAHASYASTYSLGINSLLEQCRGPAIRAADLTTIDAAGFWNLATEAKRTLRANLPGKFREDRARFFESMLEKNLVIPTVKTIPVIDGDLSDEVWGSAVELKGFTERGTYRTSRHGTTGRVMRVGDALVFGIECRQVGPIVVGTKKEIMSGGRLWKESSVEFHFGVPAAKSGEAATMAQYIVNANGAFQGFRVARDNREGCLVEVRKDDGKGVYTIEAAFPLKAPGYDFTPSRVLLLNLMRDVFTSVPATQAEDAIITWYPTPYTCYKDDSLGLVYTAP